MAAIVLAVWLQERPLIDAAQASSLALDFRVGPDHSGWKADSTTLDNSGTRPPYGKTLPGFSALPKCWGTSLPLGDGYCLPYPVWKVHIISRTAAQCSDDQVYVDARKAKVAESFGGSC